KEKRPKPNTLFSPRDSHQAIAVKRPDFRIVKKNVHSNQNTENQDINSKNQLKHL
ncbi:hypothetical protein Ancab_001966, partial [Ancistrocladus abbreviatus]